MPALPTLIANHGPLLVLDAASSVVQVGVLRADSAPAWARPAGDASSALFAGIEMALRRTELELSAIRGFLFCEGPGSMLGIRTTAMALRTWQVLDARPVFAYQSLAIAAARACSGQPGRECAVIADARRDTWHVQECGPDGRMRPLRRVATAELPSTALLMPENFRTWSTPPAGLATCSYDLAAIFLKLGAEEFFRAVEAPDAFQHEAPEYRKWSAQVHSAATAPRR